MTVTMDKPAFTGLGVVAPNGTGAENYWAATRAGRSGIGALTRVDGERYGVHVAGQVADLEPDDELPSRLHKQTDRSTKFAMIAAQQALDDAHLDPNEFEEFDGSVVCATAFGGVEFIQNELQRLWRNGPSYVTAYMSYAWFCGVNTGQLSIKHGIKGASGSMVTGQAGGLDALGLARRRLRGGQRYAVVGGTEAPLCPFGVVSLETTGKLTRDSDQGSAFRPFDSAANGQVLGEGSAMVLLEPLTEARDRGARVYGVLSGYGASFDPAPGSERPPSLAAAMRTALDDAGLAASEIDVVFADAASIADADRLEAQAIEDVFGAGQIPVTAPKSMTGRLYGAAGVVDVVTALLAIRDGEIPPTVGTTEPDDTYGLDLVVGTARPASLRHTMVLARGDGGFNSVAIVSAA